MKYDNNKQYLLTSVAKVETDEVSMLEENTLHAWGSMTSISQPSIRSPPFVDIYIFPPEIRAATTNHEFKEPGSKEL